MQQRVAASILVQLEDDSTAKLSRRALAQSGPAIGCGTVNRAIHSFHEAALRIDPIASGVRKIENSFIACAVRVQFEHRSYTVPPAVQCCAIKPSVPGPDQARRRRLAIGAVEDKPV